jgi:hypothetical protein
MTDNMSRRNDLTTMDDEQLVSFFESIFNEANFMRVWVFMKGYLDVEQSSEIGRWIMQSGLSCFLLVHFLMYV